MDETITIYADVLFFINFSLDFLCLYITAKIICAPVKTWRVISAACFGGAYSCVSLYFEGLPVYFSLAVHIAAAVVICCFAMGFSRIAAKTALFAISCALTGGIMCGAYSLAGKGFYMGGGFYFDTDPLLAVIFAVAATVSSLLYLLLCKRSESCGEVTASFSFKDRRYDVRLLCDSGCFLRDGLSGDPVAVVSSSVLKGEPDIRGADEGSLRALGKTARLIPVQTVSGTNVLAAFRPDEFFIRDGKGKKPLAVIIALDNAETNYGGFDGIIPSEVCRNIFSRMEQHR